MGLYYKFSGFLKIGFIKVHFCPCVTKVLKPWHVVDQPLSSLLSCDSVIVLSYPGPVGLCSVPSGSPSPAGQNHSSSDYCTLCWFYLKSRPTLSPAWGMYPAYKGQASSRLGNWLFSSSFTPVFPCFCAVTRWLVSSLFRSQCVKCQSVFSLGVSRRERLSCQEDLVISVNVFLCSFSNLSWG